MCVNHSVFGCSFYREADTRLASPCPPSPLAGPAETLAPASPRRTPSRFPSRKRQRGQPHAAAARHSRHRDRDAAAGLRPPQPREGGPVPAAAPGVPGWEPAPPPPAPPRRQPRSPHLLLQQRKGCAGVDPQVFGGGLPVVSQVGGPVPHHEEVQELRARGEGWGSERLRGEDAPARPGPGRSPSPGARPTAPSFTCPLPSSMPSRLPPCAFGPRRGC